MRKHLIDLARHSLDVRDDQLVEIRVAIFANGENGTDRKLVGLIELLDSCKR